jgi:hypothetical protein
MNDPAVFHDCDAARVFRDVEEKLDSPSMRALWEHFRSEMKRKGVAAATTYLREEFRRLRQDFSRELDRAKSPL